MIHENIKIKSGEREYDIEYKQTDTFLYFNDKDGASIAFLKGDGKLHIYVNDKYSNPKMWKEYPTLKGTNAYVLTPEQVKIFFDWFKEK